MRDSVTIAVILSPVGLRGEVKCSLMTDFPERFNRLRDVTIQEKNGAHNPYQIERVRFASHFVFITFKGMTSREQADLLRGAEVQVAEAERVALPEDHYFRDDIIGLDVYSEVEGILLGKVDSILETAGNDIYIVKKDDREYLIPALKSVVKKIDISKKVMMICPMEGLLDL
jgi:16S rRNA processing protein RimM